MHSHLKALMVKQFALHTERAAGPSKLDPNFLEAIMTCLKVHFPWAVHLPGLSCPSHLYILCKSSQPSTSSCIVSRQKSWSSSDKCWRDCSSHHELGGLGHSIHRELKLTRSCRCMPTLCRANGRPWSSSSCHEDNISRWWNESIVLPGRCL